jgi:DNA replication protein DnaC
MIEQKELNILGHIKYVWPTCKCVIQKQEDEIRAAEELKRKREIENKFSISALGERFEQSTFDAFKDRVGASEALVRCLDYSKKFEAYNGTSLVIWGDPGNGKSHLAAAVAKELKSRGKTVVFQTVAALLERIRNTFNQNNRETEKSVLEALYDCDLLVLDDIGAEKFSDWVLDVIFRIVDSRYRQMKPILYTSNFKPVELKERVGPRVYDRIVETTISVENKASSYRMEIAKERFARLKAEG